MIKITQAQYQYDKIIQVHFSDGSWGNYDLQPLIEKQSELLRPWKMMRFLNSSIWKWAHSVGAMAWNSVQAISIENCVSSKNFTKRRKWHSHVGWAGVCVHAKAAYLFDSSDI